MLKRSLRKRTFLSSARRLAVPACVVWGVLASACSSNPPGAGEVAMERAAEARTLEAIVLVDRAVGSADRVEWRPLHVVLLPGGILLAQTGDSVDPAVRPGRVGVVSEADVAAIWADVDRLRSERSGQPPRGAADFRLPEGGALRVLDVIVDGERRRYREQAMLDDPFGLAAQIEASIGVSIDLSSAPIDPAPDAPGADEEPAPATPATEPEAIGRDVGPRSMPEDPAVVAIIRQLAALAWFADALPPRGREAPFRYDLGGDPWARYRAAMEEERGGADEPSAGTDVPRGAAP